MYVWIIVLAVILGLLVFGLLGFALSRYREARQEELRNAKEYTNLDRAREIVEKIGEVRDVQRELKASFARNDLDGALAALSHPLYLDSERELKVLHDRLKELI